MANALESSTFYDIPRGYRGSVETVQKLAELVRLRAGDPRIRRRVLELFAGLASNNIAGEIERVWRHVLATVRYQADPIGAEHITDPVTLDELVDQGIAAEDCESMALYAATLLAAAGIPSLFEIQGRDPSDPQRFTHCSLRVIDPRTQGTISFDPVGAIEIPGFGLGDTVHRDGEPIELFDLDGERVTMTFQPFRSSSEEGSMLGAAFGDIDWQGTLDAIANGVRGAAPYFGPYGLLVGGAVEMVEGGYDVATGKTMGLPKPPPPPPPKSSGAGVALAVGGGLLAASFLL